ncbi:hypothetical protein OG342_26025 [Streptomyces bobili]|uniref:hypothetical protein n=1 Tax=Streptomyces bobili TaxID=67280 RepID=UPI00224EED58|nr:hypothetical protein [Streptomyces bobili]MCX5526272.1 hypothetical protein [Streptomyces bobili]
MNAGTRPEPGTSHLTLRTYRVDSNGRRVGSPQTRAYDGAGDPTALPDSLPWPRCRCFRCMEDEGRQSR